MPQKSAVTPSNRILQILLAVLATMIGLYPLLYFLQHNFGLLGHKNSALLASEIWSSAFYTHIITGGIALLLGWVQFSQKIRISAPAVHRNLGKVYLLLALCSSISAAYLALHADGGWVAAMGFMCLSIVWFTSTAMGYTSILKQRINQHRKFMVFSYAACFAAVMLRILLPLLVLIFQDFIKAYIVVAWLCWLPNMFVAYLLTRNMGQSK